jgi:Protein of unknown function (DUF1161)
MKKLVAALGGSLVVCLTVAPAFAQAKPCEELKTEIAAKIDAKGATGYQLEIVKTEEVKEQVVVGSCEGGTKKITYTKSGQASPQGQAAQPAEKPKAPATKPN